MDPVSHHSCKVRQASLALWWLFWDLGFRVGAYVIGAYVIGEVWASNCLAASGQVVLGFRV